MLGRVTESRLLFNLSDVNSLWRAGGIAARIVEDELADGRLGLMKPGRGPNQACSCRRFLRVAANGRPERARRVQPGLRGFDGETRSSAGLFGDRTRSPAWLRQQKGPLIRRPAGLE